MNRWLSGPWQALELGLPSSLSGMLEVSALGGTGPCVCVWKQKQSGSTKVREGSGGGGGCLVCHLSQASMCSSWTSAPTLPLLFCAENEAVGLYPSHSSLRLYYWGWKVS